MKGYTETQTKELIDLAFETQEKGGSLSRVFEEYSLACGKARGSVRNYYYFLIKQAKNDKNLVQKYPKLGKLTSAKNVSFSKNEEECLLEAVNNGVMQGKSIRKTIMELSCGDQKLALRYQNKYRNLIKGVSPKKAYPKDRLFNELSEKINALVDRMGKSLREENRRLREKNQELLQENKKLRKEISLGIIKKYFQESLDNDIVKKG